MMAERFDDVPLGLSMEQLQKRFGEPIFGASPWVVDSNLYIKEAQIELRYGVFPLPDEYEFGFRDGKLVQKVKLESP